MSKPSGIALETNSLGRRYGRRWALRDCTFELPAGRVAALVGPNGAGKTTLLHLAVGLLASSAGTIRVFGASPWEHPKSVLPRVGFVAQDHPLYRGFTVAETLELGRRLNPRWDGALALRRLNRLGIPFEQRAGKLSGGQKAQVALALALAKHPDLVLLDEPLASLDPLARRDFLRALAEAVEEDGVTVLLSSHIIGDLERVCDSLILLSAAHVQIAGEIAAIRREHTLLRGPRDGASAVAAVEAEGMVVERSMADGRATLLVRSNPPHALPDGWEAREATLEEIVLAYLGQGASDLAGERGEVGAVTVVDDLEVTR
ncbi:MAG TPA: ABC transporter ATP-binding protein [Ktedonobacterales bacterium]|nr:ABC transporter ATP-binding protein [Ktedonobacterales bacterium]